MIIRWYILYWIDIISFFINIIGKKNVICLWYSFSFEFYTFNKTLFENSFLNAKK